MSGTCALLWYLTVNTEHVLSFRRKGIWLGHCRYDVVLRVAMEHGFKLVGENDLWHVSWTDAPLMADKIAEMRRLQVCAYIRPVNLKFTSWLLQNLVGSNAPPIQKINHFPGMYELCRKDRLGRNLNRLKRIFPKEYEFFPPTWDIPSE